MRAVGFLFPAVLWLIGTSRIEARTVLQQPAPVLTYVHSERGPETDLLDRPANLQVRGVTLREALELLRRTSGIPIAYSPSLVPVDRRVTCDCADATVAQAMRALLRGTGSEFVVLADQLVIRQRRLNPRLASRETGASVAADLTPSDAAAEELAPAIQGGSITGSVTTATEGRPVANVQVYVPGTGLGALSNAQGRFIILDVPAGQYTLRAEIIGYARAEQAVSVRDDETVEVNFRLSTEALGLDEIVVTGTAGGQQRRAIGNVVGSFNAATTIEKTAPDDLEQMLAGQVAGVDIHVGGGVGTGGSVQIRGASTIALNSQPLLYIDGVRADASTQSQFQGAGNSRLNDINPEDIERIEIIKGPAAATLYGTEASNGVIQVITKKGRSGKPTVDVLVRQGGNWFQNPDGRIRLNYGLDPTRTQIISQDLYADEIAAGREMFRVGRIQNYGVSLRGGTGNLTYFLSGNRDDEQGYMHNNAQTSTSLRSNLQATISDHLDITTEIGVVKSETSFAPDGTSGTYGIIPNIVWGTPATQDTPSRGFMVGPPEIQDMIDSREQLNRATASITVNHRPTTWLTHRLITGFDWTDAKRSTFYPRLPEDSPRFYSSNSTGTKQLGYTRTLNQTFDYNITASFNLNPSVTSATSGGVQYFTRQTSDAGATGRDLPTSAVSTVSAAAVTSGDESFVENKTFGVYLQETAGWRNQAFLTAALRADGNSAFGESFKAAYYPKLSGTWVVSDAGFWNVGWANNLRLRAAWGESGLQPDAFAAIRTYSPTTGPNDVPAVTPGNVGNPDLKPEVGQELEVGFDAGILSDRVTIEATYYHKKTKDAILQERVAPSAGFPGSRYVNAGVITNHGVELALGLEPIRNSSVQLSLSATASYTKNKLVSLGGGLTELQADTRGRWKHVVGYPLGGMWTKYIASAEWQNGKLVNIMCKGAAEQNFAPMPCPQAPFHYFGDPGPNWQGSFNGTLTLGSNLTVSSLWVFEKDSWRFSTTDWYRDRTQRNSLEAQEYLLGTLDPVRAAELLTLDIENIYFQREDFLRMRDLSVSYSLPSGWVQRFGASRASITLSGRNLVLFHDPGFTDLDPEVKRIRNTSSRPFQRWEQVQAPMPASFVTTIRVTM